MKVKLRATVILKEEYEADSNNYTGCNSVDDMIAIDKKILSQTFYYFLKSGNTRGLPNIETIANGDLIKEVK